MRKASVNQKGNNNIAIVNSDVEIINHTDRIYELLSKGEIQDASIYLKDLKTLVQYWEDWNELIEPKITGSFLLKGRENIVEAVSKWYENNNSILNISAESKEEAILTFIAAVNTLDEKIKENIKNSSLIVESLDTWNELRKSCSELILIPNFQLMNNVSLPKNCRTVIPFTKDEIKQGDADIQIRRQNNEQFSQGLQEIGIESSRAYDLSYKTKRNLLVLRRHLATVSWVKKPRWTEKNNIGDLVPILLVGSLNENTEGDKKIISQISGYEYKEYNKRLSEWLILEDSPIRKILGTYQIVSLEDMWEYLWTYITPEDIEAFKKCALEVLQVEDSAFELEEKNWFAASVFGKNPVYSKEISKGIVNSLIMLALRDENSNNFNVQSTQAYVNYIVSEIYKNNDTWQKWFSITDRIDLLAEASPEETLKAINVQLNNESSPFWNLFRKSGNELFSRNYYTHILWALEKMVWSEEYATQACILLARISEKEFEYKIVNSPDNSLYEIFVPWHPQCALRSDERIELIKLLLSKTPNAAWKLIIKLLPKSSGGVVSNILKPKWREWDTNYNYKVTNLEYNEQVKIISNLVVENMGKSLERWIDVLDNINGIFREDIEKFCEILQRFSVDLSSESLLIICDKLREIINRHRKFFKSDWAMPKEIIDLLVATYNMIEPKNIIEKYSYLFKYQVNLLNPLVYSEREKGWWEKEEEQIRLDREKALVEIYQIYNLDGIVNILSNSDDVYKIGDIIASKLLNYELRWEFILRLVNLKKKSILSRYFSLIYEMKGLGEFRDFISTNRDTLHIEEINYILNSLPTNNELWKFIDELGESIKKEYWNTVDIWSLRDTSLSDVMVICNNLLFYSRPYSTVKLLGHVDIFDTEISFKALEQCLLLYPKKELSGLTLNHINYEVIELFEKMYNIIDNDNTRLAGLEWNYLPLFKHNQEPIALIRELKKDYNLFVQLITFVYKKRDNDSIPVTEEEKNRAHLAYDLLDMFKQVPGFTDGNVDKELFLSWMSQALKKCKEENCNEIGEHIIGKLLAYSPLGEDGMWPHELVRDFLEESNNDEIESGIILGKRNQRGVYTRTGGKEERRIAQEYLDSSFKMRIRWSRCSMMLKKIGDSYNYDAKREEQEDEF